MIRGVTSPMPFCIPCLSCFFLAEGADGAMCHLFLAICSSVASVVLGAVASKLACAAPRRFYVTSGQLPALLLFIGSMARQTITYVRSLCAICSFYHEDLERDGVSLASTSSFLCAELYSFNFGFLSFFLFVTGRAHTESSHVETSGIPGT